MILRTLSWIIIILLFFCSAGNADTLSSSAENKAVKVSIMTIQPAMLEDVLILPGEAEAFQDVLLAADINGLVEWIGLQEGDNVSEDQLLVKIDVSGLKAALDSAEASFNLSESLFQRRKQLFERGVAAKEELDRSETERTLTLSKLRQARVEYERGFVRSPIHGIINKIYVDVGEYVDRGTPVMNLVNVVKLKINVSVPESDVFFLKTGDTVYVTIDALPDRNINGTIDFISYTADPVTKTFQTRIIIFNHGRDIRPGMIARVVLTRRIIENALVIPLSSLVNKEGEYIVFVEEDGIARAREVSIGIIKEDEVQITRGLKTGDHLIVVGHKNVEDGIKVQIP